MKVGELIDLRKKKMVWKSTVAAGKQPSTNLGLVGISIGQQQSTGDTSTVNGKSNIHEAQMQSILKKGMKAGGTIEKVFGDDCVDACRMLGCQASDQAYELKGEDPQSKGILKSLNANPEDGLRMIRMVGARTAVSYNGRIITSKEHFDSLVEAVGFRMKNEPAEAETKSSKLKTGIRVPEFIRKVQLSSLSKTNQLSIKDALDGRSSTDVLNRRDIEQLAVLANVNPRTLRDLAGL